jgi:hypothetical protein
VVPDEFVTLNFSNAALETDTSKPVRSSKEDVVKTLAEVPEIGVRVRRVVFADAGVATSPVPTNAKPAPTARAFREMFLDIKLFLSFLGFPTGM